jgi:hypothetical protein
MKLQLITVRLIPPNPVEKETPVEPVDPVENEAPVDHNEIDTNPVENELQLITMRMIPATMPKMRMRPATMPRTKTVMMR